MPSTQMPLARIPTDRPLRVLECGGGAGGAFPQWIRLFERFPGVEFTVTDRDPDMLVHYRHEVCAWVDAAGFRMVEEEENRLRFGGGGRAFDVRFREAAIPRGFDPREDGAFDLLLAQSFWDLVGRGTALSLGRRLLAPGGIFYATLTFAGVTRFGPPHELDRRLLVCYHASMAGDRGGDPIAGERLLGEVRLPGSGFRNWRWAAPIGASSRRTRAIRPKRISSSRPSSSSWRKRCGRRRKSRIPS